MTRFVRVFSVIVLCVQIAFAQAPQRDGPTLQPQWTLTGDFLAPESAYYDAGSNAVFVSSINGQILEKDGNGYISRLAPDGKMVSAKWVTGLNAPKGLRSLGGTLWVSDIDEVVGIDIATARITARVKVEGSQFLNDLATAPDGTIYVSDSGQTRIYAVKDGKASVFVEGMELVDVPNGLLVDGTRLILGTIGVGLRGAGPGRAAGPPPSGHLYAFDRKTKQRTSLTTDAVGGIDGIEPDGRGGLLVTDVIGSRLLHVPASGQTRVLAKFSMGGAVFGYIGSKQVAIVPFLAGNSVAAYDLTASMK
jgi:DNA-binding beta-propeller fold protein YncE